ncbi:MAG: dynamin family protein [Bacteroidota bacterium]
MNNILNQKLSALRSHIDQIVKELQQLCSSIGHQELEQTVSDLRNRINDPFMFVIVGEVKAGKSSFINALLDAGKEICKVAASPMTDTIQQIVYGETEETISISPHLKKILQPVDILKEIAIVDTPGTNTIIEHHQAITESFIPASDLIVFVFEAKNPYRESAWAFFDYIHSDWRKKIVFVLQQKDLMEPEDLRVNIQGVQDYAVKKGITEPQVFAVSAKQELAGKKEESGFAAIRDYIKGNITGGKAPLLKLQNNISISTNINERIAKGLMDRKEQWEADLAFRKDVQQTLEEQARKSDKQVDVLVENLLAGYDRIGRENEEQLNEGLSFFNLMKRSVSSIFNKKTSAKVWLTELAERLEKDLNSEMRIRLDSGVVDIADSIQQMAKMIDLKIRSSHTILKNNHDIFSDIAERRANVIHELQETFARFMKRSENFTADELFPNRDGLSPNLAAGSGVAVIGVILATVTNGVVFDITGGVLTTLGLLFAGVSVGLQRRKIIKGYRNEINRGRSLLEKEVDEKLKIYIQHIQQKIDANFSDFDQLLDQEKEQIEKLSDQQRSIDQRLDDLTKELQELGTH